MIDYCVTYKNATKCAGCTLGYYLSTNETQCIKCSENCKDCELKDAKEFCNYCVDNIAPVNGTCSSSGTELTCISNCKYCADANKCEFCDEGYALDNANDTCIKIDNCGIAESTTKCLVCTIGYYNNNGVCKESEEQMDLFDESKVDKLSMTIF